WQQCNTNPWTF
nr:immunoglobulin light chain junction region [Macaca mulatta]